MNAPIKLSDQRVRELLAIASDEGEKREWASYRNDEVQALAQAVVDLRSALGLLTPHADSLEDRMMDLVVANEQLIEECERKRRELDELRGVVR